MRDLTCVGLTTLDILVRPVDALPDAQQPTLVEEIALAPAGTASGTAMVAATLGLDTAVISAVGQDVNGDIVLQLLKRAGIDCEQIARLGELPTSTSVLTIRSDGERPVFHMLGASLLTAMSPAAIETARGSRFFHFGGVGFPNLSSPEALTAVASIRAGGTYVTCDLIAPQPQTIETLRALLPYVDCSMPSEAEVRVLLGDVPVENALEIFTGMGAASCIIKRGGAGSIGRSNGEIFEVPAKSITPVDTTSCGDSYCAGFISGLSQGLSFRDAMDIATDTAAEVAKGLGTLGTLKRKVA
jgi:sugar/nucleoside kinase (ribokinase family)